MRFVECAQNYLMFYESELWFSFFAFCFSKIVIGRSRFAVCRMCSELLNVLRKRGVVYSRRVLVFFFSWRLFLFVVKRYCYWK